MAAFLICHNSRSTRQTCPLADRIARIWAPSHVRLGPVWLIEADSTADDIREQLRACLAADDALVVVRLGRDAAWTGWGTPETSWMQDRL